MDEEQRCESCPHVDVETNEPNGSPVQRDQPQPQQGQQSPTTKALFAM
jgi:hypothetical protein